MHEAHPLFWHWTIWTVHGYLNFKRSRIANPCGIYLGGKSSYGKSSIKLFVLDIRIHTHDTHLSSSTHDLQIQAMAKFYSFFYQSRSPTYLSSFPAKNLVPATIQSSPNQVKTLKLLFIPEWPEWVRNADFIITLVRHFLPQDLLVHNYILQPWIKPPTNFFFRPQFKIT